MESIDDNPYSNHHVLGGHDDPDFSEISGQKKKKKISPVKHLRLYYC